MRANVRSGNEPGVLVIDANEVQAALPFDELVPALREAFAEGCEIPLRHHHFIETPGEPVSTLLLMPAWSFSGFLGVKIVSVCPGNSEKGIAALSSTYLLCDRETGRRLAIIDGDTITGRRTAAASALAASFLAREDASALLIVGTGRVASLLAGAFRTVRPITKISVWDIRERRAEKLAETLRLAGFDATAQADLEAAARMADIVSCATLSTSPLIEGAWLKPGAHLDLIGSFTPSMRETDDEAFERCKVFVDTHAALEESGDILGPISTGRFRREAVCGTLESLCRGFSRGREVNSEITLFKSVGTALEDLTAAGLVYRKVTSSALCANSRSNA